MSASAFVSLSSSRLFRPHPQLSLLRTIHSHPHLPPPRLEPPLPAPPLVSNNHQHPSISLSDSQIDSFYHALLKPNQSPAQPALKKPSPAPSDPLTPIQLDSLLRLQTSTLLDPHLRKSIISKILSLKSPPPSSRDRHVQAASVQMLRNQSCWSVLFQSAAYHEDVEDLVQMLQVIHDFGHEPSLVLGQTLACLGAVEDDVQASRMKQALIEAGKRLDIASSSATHQAEVDRILYRTGQTPAQALEAADSYVRRLEKAGSPASVEVYLQLFHFMNYISMRRSTSIELFNRMRLLAHPNPPITVWNALLKALGSGASTEPERSMDIFLDLKAAGHVPTVETYNHLIRAMVRARRSAPGTAPRRAEFDKWYSSALRLLGQMVREDGIRPDLGTYAVLLEGAKRAGDLARAKWTYGLFSQQLAHDRTQPLGDGRELDWVHVKAATSLLQTYASFSPPMKRLQTKQTPGLSRSPLDEPDFFQRLPQNPQEVLAEAEAIVGQFVSCSEPLEIRPAAESRADQRKLSFLISSYLSVYSSHATIDTLYSKYQTLTRPIESSQGFGPIRISWTYLIIMERCEFVRSAQKAGQIGREVFEEWKRNREGLKEAELVKSIDSRLVSQVWAVWIRLIAKYGGGKEAMAEIERFASEHPAHEMVDLESLSPFLTFRHLELVHHRLKSEEDRGGIKRLVKIVKGYEFKIRQLRDQAESHRKTRAQTGFQ